MKYYIIFFSQKVVFFEEFFFKFFACRICSVIIGFLFGVYLNPLALKIASGEREPFIGEGKRFEMKSAGGICGTQYS